MHMTTPSRDRSRRGHRAYEEEFVLYLQGIPAHCRWQELKDFVRQTALHIRQAVVYDDENGYPTGLGQIIVKNEDEAWRTFRKLSTSGWEGQPLTVTLARASSPTRPIAGPARSSSVAMPAGGYTGKFSRHAMSATPAPESPVPTESSRAPSITATTNCPPLIPVSPYATTNHGHVHYPFPVPIDPGFQSPTWNLHPEMLPFSPTMTVFPDQIEYPYYFPYSLPMPFSMHQPIYTENGHDYQRHSPSYIPRPSTAPFIAPPNSYRQHGYQAYGYEPHKNNSTLNSATNMFFPNETPSYYNTGVNSQQPMSMQATCNIIIDNIRPDVDQQALQNHFRNAGHMLNCEIIRYNTDGNGASYNKHNYPGQCYATATFSSPEEAEKAVMMYNGSDLAGSRVVVRLDSEWNISTDDPTTGGGGADGSGESDWSRSLSFTTTSTLPLRSSVSESTVASMGAFSAYSESSNPQSSAAVPARTHRNHYHHNRNRRDSGKGLVNSTTSNRQTNSEEVEEYNNNDDDEKTPNKQNKIKYIVPTSHSSRSVSPKSGDTEGSSMIQQPLVVNGSIVGKAKM